MDGVIEMVVAGLALTVISGAFVAAFRSELASRWIAAGLFALAVFALAAFLGAAVAVDMLGIDEAQTKPVGQLFKSVVFGLATASSAIFITGIAGDAYRNQRAKQRKRDHLPED